MTNELNKTEIQDIVHATLEEAGTMTRSDVSEVVKEAVQETLITLGVDANHPLTVQQDMHFLRELRGASEKVQSRGLVVLVGLLITAAAAAIWLGIKTSLTA